jgi:hypothetical protein
MVPIKIKYSEKLIRQATRSYWSYSVGAPYLFTLAPLALLFIYHVSKNDPTWIAWACGLGALYCSTIMIYLYVGYMKGHIGWIRSMKGFEASLEIGEEELCISSVAKSEVIEWKSICEIKHYKNFWILVLSPNLFDYVILPANELSKGIKDNIESKIHSVLYTSGQGWKIRAQLACGNLSIIFLLVPFVIDSFPSQWVVSSYLIGGLFAIVSIYYLFNIRCPKCRAN